MVYTQFNRISINSEFFINGDRSTTLLTKISESKAIHLESGKVRRINPALRVIEPFRAKEYV